MKPLIKPLPCTELYPHLTHRPPMVWIDWVISVEETCGTTTTQLKTDGYYNTDGIFRPSSLIELIAQSYAFTSLVYCLQQNTPPTSQKNYLVAIKDFKLLTNTLPQAPQEIRTEVQRKRVFGQITFISGQCYLNDRLLATGDLKVFSENI